MTEYVFENKRLTNGTPVVILSELKALKPTLEASLSDEEAKIADFYCDF